MTALEEERWSASTLALLAQNDPEQLQLHAKNIRHLEFDGDCHLHELFKYISFPILERVVLDTSYQNNEESLEPYLQPTLKGFIFYGGPISDTFLEKLQVHPPFLS